MQSSSHKPPSYGTITRTEENGETGKSTNQVLLSCIATSVVLGSGLSMGFSAVALPYMLAPGSSLPINEDQASWFASLSSISAPVGCLLGGHLLDRFGRRPGLMFNSFPFVLGWLLIGVSPTLTPLYLGRLLTGIGAGFSSIPATVYTAEITDSSLQGPLIVGTTISMSVGAVIVYILGAILQSQWELVAVICAGFSIAATMLVFFNLPESPVWLITKGRIEEASRSLMRIDCTTSQKQVRDKLQILVGRSGGNPKSCMSPSALLTALTRPEAYKPLIIMNTFFFFQYFTGPGVLIVYSVDMVRIAGVNMDPFLVTILLGVIRLVFMILAAYLSKRFGRRKTATMSGLGTTLSLLILATYLYLYQLPAASDNSSITSPIAYNETLSNGSKTIPNTIQEEIMREEGVSYIPITMLVFYSIASTIGFLTIPRSMIGEVFPTRIRGIASGITMCVAYIMSALVLKFYPSMKNTLGNNGVFFFFCVMSFLGTLFIILFLPETEGKTLEEIQRQFNKKGDVDRVYQDDNTTA